MIRYPQVPSLRSFFASLKIFALLSIVQANLTLLSLIAKSHTAVKYDWTSSTPLLLEERGRLFAGSFVMLKIFATLGIAQASLALLLFIAKSHQRLSMVSPLRGLFECYDI